MKWIKSPDWTDDTAHLLHYTLREAIHESGEIKQLCLKIGMDPSHQYWGDPAVRLWPAVTRDATEEDLLDRLVWEMRKSYPALADDFDRVLNAELPSESWYNCRDPFKSKLIGPGNTMAVLDRDGLRTGLIDIARHRYPVLAIYGAKGSGRSYSRRVLQHVAGHPSTQWQLVIVDAQDLPERAHAWDLLRKLADRLGLEVDFDRVDGLTENTWKAKESVGIFIREFTRHSRAAKRWIFLDSLDQGRVTRDLNVAVCLLASEIEYGQLGETRLIVAGYQDIFTTHVEDVLRREEINEIADPQIRTFFGEVGQDIGRTVETEELDRLVAEVRARAGEGGLRALGRAASEVAHGYFGGTG
jgi:hypothetical protein